MLRNVRVGAIAGLAGGVVFGMMMGMMGMLSVIAGMVGSSSPVVGFGVHLVMSAMIGAGFGVTLSSFASSTTGSIGAGAAYGMAWWVIGPLTMMPLMMGKGFATQWTVGAATAALPSLMGHAIYGMIAGFVFYRLRGSARAPKRALRTA